MSRNIFRKNNAKLAEEKAFLGNYQYKAQNYESALKFYSDAISLRPDSPAYYCNRAACQIMLGNHKAAHRDVCRSVQLDELGSGVVIARSCLSFGKITSAERALRKLQEAYPSCRAIKSEMKNCQKLRALEDKIRINYEKKGYWRVVFFLDSALRIAPVCLKYKILKAECLAFLGRVEEAGDIAVTVMKIDPTSADAVYVRGLCLYYSDNILEGIEYFNRALQLDPDHSKARKMRRKSKLLSEKKEQGNVFFKSGKWREAQAVYTDALEIDPLNKVMNSKLYYNRAVVNSKLGNLRDSIIDCTKVLEINSQYLKALLLRAKCYNDLEKYDDCLKDYESALKIEKTAEIKNLLQDAKFALNPPKQKDYYEILGVTRNASDEEIRAAYRKKAQIHHPDKNVTASDGEKKRHALEFKKICEAYAVLTDPSKKLRYDSGQDMDNE